MTALRETAVVYKIWNSFRSLEEETCLTLSLVCCSSQAFKPYLFQLKLFYCVIAFLFLYIVTS
jgi:hypothetical protein